MDKPKAIISLFDLTGQMCKPWADAGITCFLFDMQHDCDSIYPHMVTTGGDASTWAVYEPSYIRGALLPSQGRRQP